MFPSMRDDRSRYLPSDGLVEAAEVAVQLGMPLLLTGEPGVGKTQAGYWLAGTKDSRLLEYAVRSTSTASELFYGYNALAHYHAAGLAARPGAGGATDAPELMALRFLHFHALGEAILLAACPEDVAGLYARHPGVPSRSVVLLDEIDKAPRDLPNDILRAVETMTFSIPELGGRTVTADTGLRPIVVATSNSERTLPDAFLRRCIYYHIPFPDEPKLRAIVTARLGLPSEAPILADALRVFSRFRVLGLRKPPSTAELINFLDALRPIREPESTGRSLREREKKDWEGVALACLVKTEEDRGAAHEVLETWTWDAKP
jgi:MoxR-like ATPase